MISCFELSVNIVQTWKFDIIYSSQYKGQNKRSNSMGYIHRNDGIIKSFQLPKNSIITVYAIYCVRKDRNISSAVLLCAFFKIWQIVYLAVVAVVEVLQESKSSPTYAVCSVISQLSMEQEFPCTHSSRNGYVLNSQGLR